MPGSDEFYEPASFGEAETKEKRSLFIGRVFRAENEEEARERIREISRKHADASHNCWAYRVGSSGTVEYFSDAGEPSGTAGKPILGAILRADVVNAVVIVTRYFGGTKLGVRGLIEAYGKCASLALDAAGRKRRVRSRKAFVECSYEYAQAIIRQLMEIGIPEEGIAPEWGSCVRLVVEVPLALVGGAEPFFEGYAERGFITCWGWEK